MRENLILTRMDDTEKYMLIALSKHYNISKADVIRMLVTREYRYKQLDEAYEEYGNVERR